MCPFSPTKQKTWTFQRTLFVGTWWHFDEMSLFFVSTMSCEYQDKEMFPIVKTFCTFNLNMTVSGWHNCTCVHVLRCDLGAAIWTHSKVFSSKENEQKHSIFHLIIALASPPLWMTTFFPPPALLPNHPTLLNMIAAKPSGPTHKVMCTVLQVAMHPPILSADRTCQKCAQMSHTDAI